MIVTTNKEVRYRVEMTQEQRVNVISAIQKLSDQNNLAYIEPAEVEAINDLRVSLANA